MPSLNWKGKTKTRTKKLKNYKTSQKISKTTFKNGMTLSIDSNWIFKVNHDKFSIQKEIKKDYMSNYKA